jgi:hypothetical protein
MRTQGIFTLFIVAAAVFSGCRKEGSAIIAVDNGRWKVTKFSENGEDQTNRLAGYALSFKEDYSAAAANSNGTVNGSWSCGKRNNHMTFGIRFSPDPLNRISKDWDVLDQCGNRTLILGNGSGSETDRLTLEKM